MKPLVSVCAIEALTFLADSTGKPSTPPSPNPTHSFQFDEKITSGDDEDVWE